MADFQDELQNPTAPKVSKVSNKDIVKEINADNEKDYLKGLKKKNKGYLIEGLDLLERDRVARYITDQFKKCDEKHDELCDNIDEADAVYRMERTSIPGDDGTMPNYRSPLSTVTLEVIHANLMNVFFTPKDLARALPTEEGDIPKIQKLNTFMNWSCKNELEAFEKIDQLFHNSTKVGECPYIVHWVKEYGTEIKRKMIMNPANPGEPLVDPDTQKPLYQEIEEQKLLYNGPRLEVFSRKDYFQPLNSLMGKTPEWEARRIRLTYDQYLREQLQGKMFPGTAEDITDWSGSSEDTAKIDFEGDNVPMGRWEQEFREWYGRLRLKVIKDDADDETLEYEELEDEFIAIIHLPSETLCSLRKNKFPLKMRPMGMDYFIPDDEGRRVGLGVVTMLDSQQKAYDVMWNQFIFGTMQANNPIIFYAPTGNQRDEPQKLKNGYMYPSSDPNSLKVVQLPGPTPHITMALELVQQWTQLLFGISDYSAGVESKVDPSAPAKKAELVVAQGNVRLNAIIKRKNKTIQDILLRWFLLYKENMPPNKFMRIAGAADEDPFKFTALNISDFALQSNPDFELTGNILNSNKNLEAQKAVMIYQLLSQNPFFMPNSQPGILALHSLTKWLIDKLDETGLDRFIPQAPGETVQTPEEENARFMQGDTGEPTEQEDHKKHLQVHNQMLADPNVPDEVKELIVPHARKHVELLRTQVAQAIMMQQQGINPQQFQQGGQGGQQQNAGAGTPRPTDAVLPGQPAGVAGR